MVSIILFMGLVSRVSTHPYYWGGVGRWTERNGRQFCMPTAIDYIQI